jgi:hypothetical protein
MKRIALLLIGFLLISLGSSAQTITAKTKKIFVDFSNEEPSELLLIQPQISTNRGFIKVIEDNLTVEGVVSDGNGLKAVYLNDEKLVLDNMGHFLTTIYLAPGNNELKFEIQDDNDVITPKLYYVEMEAPVVVATPMGMGKFYALIIGVQDYDDPSINDLDNPIKDASALYDLITEEYTFEPEDVTFLQNPTKDDILDEFDNMRVKVEAEDNLLVFYAGHGHWDSDDELGFWLPSNAKPGKRRDWVSNSSVKDFVKSIDSKHTLLVTDACFGGSIFKTRKAFMDASLNVNKLYETISRKAMTSGTLTEVPDKSVFMKYILKNLSNNEEKYFPSEHLFFKIKPAVSNNSDNIPQFGVVQGSGDEGGDFIFIKRDY